MGTVDAGRPGRYVVPGVLTAMLLLGLSGPVDRAVATPEVGAPVAPRGNPASDFDGDGYADLAVSAEIWPATARREGVTAKGDQIWSRRTKGLGDRRRLDSDLGLALITGNFGHDYNGRRYDDLVATAYDSTGVDLVEIIYGSAGGLSTKHSRGWDLDSPGIQGEMIPNGTSFGTALAAGRFDGREHDDLVIGDDAYDEGLFVVINGSPSGLTAARNRLWTADDFRQPGLMYLGKALTSG